VIENSLRKGGGKGYCRGGGGTKGIRYLTSKRGVRRWENEKENGREKEDKVLFLGKKERKRKPSLNERRKQERIYENDGGGGGCKGEKEFTRRKTHEWGSAGTKKPDQSHVYKER